MTAPTGEQELPTGRAARRRRARRSVGGGVALAAVVGLGGGVLWLGTPTPLVTVMSPSMEPTLGVGEIALMGAMRGTPEVGDIVQVPVPRDVQREKSYPSAVVHRIIEITDGRVITQGDNLDAPDPFDVPISAVDRRLVTVVPGAGRVVSFVMSPFGLIWIGVGAFMFFGYPVIERNRERHQVETVETKTQLQHVAAAVADYGHHLKSHTEIVIAMSQAAQDLSAVVSRLEGSIPPANPQLTSPVVPVAMEVSPVVPRRRRTPLRAQPASPAPRRVPLRARPLAPVEPTDAADPIDALPALIASEPVPAPRRVRPLVASEPLPVGDGSGGEKAPAVAASEELTAPVVEAVVAAPARPRPLVAAEPAESEADAEASGEEQADEALDAAVDGSVDGEVGEQSLELPGEDVSVDSGHDADGLPGSGTGVPSPSTPAVAAPRLPLPDRSHRPERPAVPPRRATARPSSSRPSSSRPTPSRRHARKAAHVGWVVAAVAAGVTIGARHHANAGWSARTRRR